jgi:outer membrane protein assembly factor BamD (BamD/ComL family)
MYAESLYAQKKYPNAQDAYGELMKKYTATRYTEKSTQRLYAIAQYWLGNPPTSSEIELAQYSEGTLNTPEGDKEIPVPRNVAIAPNFTDKSKPFFDTHGRALQALTAVWLNDPTGPLADDALLTAATYHLRRKDYTEADHFFNILREEYPQSEHVETSYVVGQRVKLLAYQGAKYDGKALDDARKLTGSTLKLFPDIRQRQRLAGDLDEMNTKTVERDWTRVELYMRKRAYSAAATYCALILRQYPESGYAERARGTLLKIGPEKAGEAWNALPRPSMSARDRLPSVPGTDESRDDEPSPGDDEATEDPIEVDEDPVPPPRPAAPARRTSPVRRPPPPEYEPEPEPAFEEPAMEGDSPGEFEQDDSGSNYTESPPPRSGGGPGRARLVGGEE